MQYRHFKVGLSDKGILIPTDKKIQEYIKDNRKDHYISIYKFNENHKKHFEEVNSISGIRDTLTDQLVWDFDHKDFEIVRKETIDLIGRLNELNIDTENIKIYYSGNKGTHVLIDLDKDITPQEFKAATQKIADGLISYDSTVSNATRCLRIENTRHQKTNLYKVELNYDELVEWKLEDIQGLAKEASDLDHKVKKVSLPDYLLKVEKKSNVNNINVELSDLNYKDKPTWLSHWKYALLNGYFPEGMRSYALMILAATYKAQGLPKTTTYHALKGSAELQAERYGGDKFPKEEIYNNIIDQVYSTTWQNGTYAEDNFPEALKKFLLDLNIPRQEIAKLEDQQIENVNEGFEDFVNYAEESEKYTMKFGIPSLDKNLKIRKGHLIGLIAAPGAGKSSLAFTIASNMSKNNTQAYFGSYDMFRYNVYQKLIQRHTSYTEDELFQFFIDKDVKKIEEFRQILLDNYSNVSFCFKVGQSIEDLKNSIKLQEEKLGKTIELVIVDYLELILTKATDPTAASAEAAQGLREIANEGRVVLMLLQPNKLSSKPNEPLLSYNAAKGSSSIAQAATAILTAHRPGQSSTTPQTDKYFSINCVKNRNGALFALDFAWDGPTQTITELDDVGKAFLKQMREERTMEGDDWG